MASKGAGQRLWPGPIEAMPSYFVIVSPSYGGAEKRFFDVFTSMRRQSGDVFLVAPSSLVEQLRADHPDRQDVLEALLIVPLGEWSRPRFVRGWRRLLRTLPHGGSFHYPLNCLWPLHLGRGDRVSMSVADCTSVPGPRAGKRTSLWAWISFFFVDRIDVLSPAIFAAMQSYRRAAQMSLTPGGTFIVPAAPDAARAGRSATVVFVGRLVQGKGLDDLLDVLPALCERLRERTPGVDFRIAGYGPLQAHVAGRVSALCAAGVPVRFVGFAAADELLARSTVLLSMQETTNYPSRVVAEALMAGCGVIVRDTGDSREFGDSLPGLLYCAARLDAQQLAEQIGMLVQRVQHEPGFTDTLSNAARARFAAPHYVDYFRELMCGQPA
jgi:glycosyltransferase involved in cell wall biosynthesis